MFLSAAKHKGTSALKCKMVLKGSLNKSLSSNNMLYLQDFEMFGYDPEPYYQYCQE